MKLNRRVGGRVAAFAEVARQAPGGGWAFDPRQVSCNTTFFPPRSVSLIVLRQDLFPEVLNQPQTIQVTRGELFGNQLLPGRNAADVWGLSLARFRVLMRNAAVLQGLTRYIMILFV